MERLGAQIARGGMPRPGANVIVVPGSQPRTIEAPKRQRLRPWPLRVTQALTGRRARPRPAPGRRARIATAGGAVEAAPLVLRDRPDYRQIGARADEPGQGGAARAAGCEHAGRCPLHRRSRPPSRAGPATAGRATRSKYESITIAGRAQLRMVRGEGGDAEAEYETPIRTSFPPTCRCFEALREAREMRTVAPVEMAERARGDAHVPVGGVAATEQHAVARAPAQSGASARSTPSRPSSPSARRDRWQGGSSRRAGPDSIHVRAPSSTAVTSATSAASTSTKALADLALTSPPPFRTMKTCASELVFPRTSLAVTTSR